MQSINFEFLRDNNQDLTELGSFAEQYVYTDPAGSIVKLRTFGERLLKSFFRLNGIDYYPQSNQMELLKIMQEQRLAPPVVLDKLHFVRKLGNRAAHGQSSDINQQAATDALKQAFDLGKWFSLSIYNDKSIIDIAFQPPEKPETTEKLKQKNKAARQKIAEQEAQMLKLLEELEKTRNTQDIETHISTDEVALNASYAADILDYSESEIRDLLIDQMLAQAGWDVGRGNNDTADVKKEFPVDDQPTQSGNGRIDYVLWDSDTNKPIAVIEAKKATKDAESGKQQAKFYAEALEKKYDTKILIFYTNGYDTYIWNSAFGEIPRRIYGYYNKASIKYQLWQRDERLSLINKNPNNKIIDRPYQIEAVKRVCEKFDGNRRKALIVLATGTGKTRVAIALCDLLIKCRWAKRILFLCDRRELRKQARNAFSEYIEDESVIDVSAKTYKDRNKSIYIATYPAMIKCFQSFDAGFFDLVIADESHRSIYNRYRDLFLYFDAFQVGLTATPRQVISHNTYSMFECEDDDPTSFYSYDQATDSIPPYLAKYEVIKHDTKFLRDGIRYTDMNDEQKQQLEEQLADAAEAVDYAQPQVDREVMNIDTNKRILRNLMDKGRRVGGQHIGKTIIFARSHRHAMLLQKIFDEMYPQYNLAHKEFCAVIDNYIERAEQLIDDFKGLGNNNNLTIAISVDMLDTGIDIPEVVNLVFAKPIKSYVKFWQMIGRGTRLCENLFGPGKDKKKFMIFDHWANFEYFDEDHTEHAPSAKKTLLQRLFEARISLAEQAIAKQDIESFELATDLILKDVRSLPENSISVKDKWKSVHEAQNEDTIKRFDAATIALLRNDIAPLMQWRTLDISEDSYRFDLLIAKLQKTKIIDSADYENYRGLVQGETSSLPINLSQVASKQKWLNKAKSSDFWEEASVTDIDQLRSELRGLMQYKQGSRGGGRTPLIIDVTDTDETFESVATKLTGRDLAAYRHRVEGVLVKLFDQSAALQKIKHGQAVSDQEINALVQEVIIYDPLFSLDDLLVQFPNKAKRFDLAIRQIIGLESEEINDKFNIFIQAYNLNAYQMRFLDMIKNHISQYGILEIEKLYDAPFTSLHGSGIDGVFSNEEQADELMNIIEEINEFAPTV